VCVASVTPLASGASSAPRAASASPALELYALESDLAAARTRAADL